MTFDVSTGEQSGLAGYFLETAKAHEQITAVFSDGRIFGHGVLIRDAGEVASGPDSCVNDVSGIVHGVGHGGAGWHDGDVESVDQVFFNEIALENARLLFHRLRRSKVSGNEKNCGFHRCPPLPVIAFSPQLSCPAAGSGERRSSKR